MPGFSSRPIAETREDDLPEPDRVAHPAIAEAVALHEAGRPDAAFRRFRTPLDTVPIA